MRSLAIVVLLAITACGKTPNTPIESARGKVAHASKTNGREKKAETTESVGVSPNIRLGSDIIAACNIRFGDAHDAPKFDFDQAALLQEDMTVLDQVAECLSSGPLRGRAIELVGRADPRGTVEYNFALGAQRAHGVAEYLVQHGVAGAQMNETSRGELDAEGVDEDSWRVDRRVDLVLAS